MLLRVVLPIEIKDNGRQPALDHRYQNAEHGRYTEKMTFVESKIVGCYQHGNDRNDPAVLATGLKILEASWGKAPDDVCFPDSHSDDRLVAFLKKAP